MEHPVEVKSVAPTEKVKEVVKTKDGKKVVEKVKNVPAKSEPSKTAVSAAKKRV